MSALAQRKSPVRRRTQAERRDEAETKLIEAASRLLIEKGYDGFTLAEVGEAAGYSRGLPAHYFGRKEDLLALVAQRTVDSYRAKLSILEDTERGLPRLTAQIRQYIKGGTTSGSQGLLLLFSEATIRPELLKTIRKLNSVGSKWLEEEIRIGIERGSIRPDVDVTAQARVIYAFMRGQMMFSQLDPEFDPAGTGEEFIAMVESRLGLSR